MRVIKRTKFNAIANVFVAADEQGRMIEFVESTQPPLTIGQKWVMIVSTLFGCPVSCGFCDAGGNFRGLLTKDEILFQMDYMSKDRFPESRISTSMLKIQFSRMGEPSYNPAVLDVLEILPGKFKVPRLVPSLSTVAPSGSDGFFERLTEIKRRLYPKTFQLQFSIHSSDPMTRDALIPVKKWDFCKIADYGDSFYQPGGRKITLNFVLTEDTIIDSHALRNFFSPDIFLIKLTPVNPTFKAFSNGIRSLITLENQDSPEAVKLKESGYEVILSIGEWEENKIGSNCGQFINTYLASDEDIPDCYTHILENVDE